MATPLSGASSMAMRSLLAELTAAYTRKTSVEVAFESASRAIRRGASRRNGRRWPEPLMTINREHLISEAMRACGGANVFADLPLLTPSVRWKATVAADRN